jgi:UBX domain-containing protein 1
MSVCVRISFFSKFFSPKIREKLLNPSQFFLIHHTSFHLLTKMPRIATLDSILKGNKDEEEEGGNEYFTGGTGNEGRGSGLAVLAPNQGNSNNTDPQIKAIMGRIQKQQQEASPAPRRLATVTVFSNGFTLNDGPFRPILEAPNRAFLESLQQGYCPDELVREGQPADVSIFNKMTEEYKPPSATPAAAPLFNPFAGAGTTVGGNTVKEGVLVFGTTDGSLPQVNESVDKTNLIRVQVKFQQRKEVFTFEKHHTVRDLIFMIEAKFGGELNAYQLFSASRGPPKVILHDSFDQTLTEAGLAGALVTVQECDI